MQLKKWIANPRVYLDGLALLGVMAAAACSKPATYPTNPITPPVATAPQTPYPTVTPPATANATYPTAPEPAKEPALQPQFRPLVNADGRYDPVEWTNARGVDFPWGKLMYKNDIKISASCWTSPKTLATTRL